jgi:hypothetical protein
MSAAILGKPWYEFAPTAAKPYIQLARMDKMAGSMLFFWPAGLLRFLPD